MVCSASHCGCIPVSWSVKNPVSIERRSGCCSVSKVDCSVTLHVMSCISTCGWIDVWRIAINGESQVSTEWTKSFRIRCYWESKHVAQEWERSTVCTRRVRCDVNCWNDHSTLVITASSHDDVLAVSSSTQKTLEVSSIFHVAVADSRNILCAYRVCVENCCSNGTIAFKSLEGCCWDIIHDRMVRVCNVKSSVGNLRFWSVSALNIHSEWKSTV